MKKLFAVLAILALLVVGGPVCTSRAQTTYPATHNGAADFICDAASVYPVTSFSQFSCRGVSFHGANNALAGTYYFQYTTRNWFDLYTVNGDVARPPVLGRDFIVEVTGFTQPNTSTGPVTPGTFAFNWTLTDAHNVAHIGSVSGLWVNVHVCGGKSCWYHPELLSNSITFNN
jgi:hypothetical protein